MLLEEEVKGDFSKAISKGERKKPKEWLGRKFGLDQTWVVRTENYTFVTDSSQHQVRSELKVMQSRPNMVFDVVRSRLGLDREGVGLDRNHYFCPDVASGPNREGSGLNRPDRLDPGWLRLESLI